jgi:putative endonuclease
MYYTYILQSETNGRFYVGSTDNLKRRVAQHNDPHYTGSKTTKRFEGPWKLVQFESYPSRSRAVTRERQIKAWKSRKAIARLIKDQRAESRHVGINHRVRGSSPCWGAKKTSADFGDLSSTQDPEG